MSLHGARTFVYTSGWTSATSCYFGSNLQSAPATAVADVDELLTFDSQTAHVAESDVIKRTEWTAGRNSSV
jgi:hypothetical protein